MNELEAKIIRQIAIGGPISISDYMTLCLFDPQHGYYTTREPFGPAGDFITAPEISQMFGELVAIWLYGAWKAIGAPLPVTVAEIGPGRGTMMADMLRTFAQLDKDFHASADFALIEASPRLVSIQKETLQGANAAPIWLPSLENLKPQPLLIAGNELFDVIPMRQYMKSGGRWHERCISIGPSGSLAFTLGPTSPDPLLLPPGSDTAPDGSIIEIAPQRFALMEDICARIADQGGAGLFIDYGYRQPAPGDTLQAVRAHKPVGIFDDPGTADLTAHVDFASLARAANRSKLDARLATQGEFLLTMGLLERAGTLGARADVKRRAEISAAVERLAGDDAMGKLFKVMAVARPGVQVPPITAAD